MIDFMAWIGWATDLKTASPELVRQRILRTGGLNNNKTSLDETEEKGDIWGWDDPEMNDEDKKLVMILNKDSNSRPIN